MDKLQNYFDLKEGRVKLFFSLTIIALVLLSWLGLIDDISTDYIDSALIQATVAFGTARMLNALISVMQSTSVEFSFFVTGGSIGIGQLLDPINDLVEQYSSLMKLSIGSLVIQKVLLLIVSDTLFKVLITLSGLALLISIHRETQGAVNLLMKTFVFMCFLRFALVLVVALNGLVDNHFLFDQTRQDMASLEALPVEVESMKLEGLSSEEIEAAAQEATAMLDERSAALDVARAEAETSLSEVNKTLAEAEENLATLEAELTQIQRLNPFAREEQHTAALDRVSNLRTEHRDLSRVLTTLQADSEKIEKERLALAEAGMGERTGLWDSISGGVSGIGSSLAKYGNPATYMDMQVRFEAAIDTMVRVMSLFVLRTLILPLLFFFMLLKGFRLIWGIDARELLSKGKRDKTTEPSPLPQAQG
ncbi:MAG: hypothetical protein CVV07_00380 [Gammaproteobacteria bacterium HGW-Gammaproteobacteria-11]|nr:MAG: hypothetical protein CVV07_00380 [Gammaproteobacteria bacterium HGW-Gammaproteobacteria-11]